MSARLRFRIILLCFFLSGLTALIYQTAWTREFAFVFGTSELAVATVLAAYMGGLAVGSAAAARFALRVQRPVLLYGLLELAIGVSALLVPLAIRAVTVLHHFAFAGQVDAGGIASALFYVMASFLVLGVPTAFMGATLPLLARQAVRSDSELGPRIGLLYSMNTVGAVVGTVLAAFLLLPALGLSGTVGAAVAINALIFVLASWVSRGGAPTPIPPPADADAGGTSTRAWILPLVFASGVASFTYEVLWTRLLGNILGGSVYAFATMLASFLLGIAIGAALAARHATSSGRAALGYAIAQLGTALLGLVAFTSSSLLPPLAGLFRGGQPWWDALVTLLFLLPATICIGATFPFAVRVLARAGSDAGPATARVYAWNTGGAILGALGAGFVLLPVLGFAGTFQAAALLNVLLAGAVVWLAVPRSRLLGVLALGVGLLLVTVPPATPWAVLRTGPFDSQAAHGKIAFFSVGRSATVLVLERDGHWNLRTNGLPEASIQPPGGLLAFRTARWLTALPVLARPEARSMLVIGLGGGIAVEAVPRSVERIDVVELEPEVVEANRALSAVRARDPLADPRIRLLLNDARGALALSQERYDAIVSQPSHPWTAGASHLYTREFFALARDRLTPEGVLLQWIGPGFVDADLLRILVATLEDVFPHVVMHQPHRGGGILLLASLAPLDATSSGARALAAAPDEFGALGIHRIEDVAASTLLDEAGSSRFAAGAPLSRDRQNYLQMRSPLLRRRGVGPLVPGPLLVGLGLAPELEPGLDRLLLVRRLLDLGFVARARLVASTFEDPIEGAVAKGLVLEAAGSRAEALTIQIAVLEQEPAQEEAREALFRLRGPIVFEGELRLEGAGSPERAFRDAILQEARSVAGDVSSAALDARLAEILPGGTFFGPATRLRARLRRISGGEKNLEEAVRLLDTLAARKDLASDPLERARVGAALEDEMIALSSVEGWLRRPASPTRRQREAREVLRLLESLPDSGEWEAWRRSLGVRVAQIFDNQSSRLPGS